MNERIRELAEQAGWSDDRDFATWNKLHQWQNFDKEKFAELIIRECARVYWNIDQSEIHTEYVNDLKKHFGVEEPKEQSASDRILSTIRKRS